MPPEVVPLSAYQSDPHTSDSANSSQSPATARPRVRRRVARAVGPVFTAILAVYLAQALVARAERPASIADSKPSTGDVKVLDEPTDLFNDGGATTQPTTQPDTDQQGQPVNPGAMQLNPDGTFTLNITRDADLVETLRLIGFQAQKSVVPSKDVHGVLPALDLYNVTAHEALDAILRVNGFAYKEQGNFIYVYSQKELADMEKASRVAETRVFRLHYTPAANAIVMIKPALSADGQVAISAPAETGIDTGGTGGGGGGGKDTGGDSHSTEDVLVVHDYPENLDAAGKILKEIDTRPQQILIEATILQATLQENNQFGVNLTAFDGVNFSTLNNMGSSSSSSSSGSSGSSGSTSGSSGVQEALNGNIINDSASGAVTDKGFVGGSISGTNGLQFAMVYNNIALFINALESVTDTTILANPKILALNKQHGEVVVGREDGYLTTTVTQTTSTQTVEFLQTGTTLSFRPFIGDDGYIRMEIHPEDSSGGINTLGGQNLPFKTTTEVTSNIMVKDGHTIVIGGLFRESSSTTRSQVPFMGNLPLVGSLFGQTQDATTRQEIIILLTPHIIKDEASYAAAGAEEMKLAEQVRVGGRKELMPSGRERLAECSYEQAVAELHKPDPDRQKALWYLDSATNLNPRFIEAIQLKEELTGKVVTDVDNSTIRSFVAKQILAEEGLKEYTAPSVVPIMPGSGNGPSAETPTTQSALRASLTPAVQPVAQSPIVPTTAPAVATTPPATQPTTQPLAVTPLSMAEPTTQPSTQPTAARQSISMPLAVVPATQPAAPVAMVDDWDAGPTTQPSTEPSSSVAAAASQNAIANPFAGSPAYIGVASFAATPSVNAAPVGAPIVGHASGHQILEMTTAVGLWCRDECGLLDHATQQVVAVSYARAHSTPQTTITELPDDAATGK